MLPNNGNVILAAEHAAALATRPVAVVRDPHASRPDGTSQSAASTPRSRCSDNAAAMDGRA